MSSKTFRLLMWIALLKFKFSSPIAHVVRNYLRRIRIIIFSSGLSVEWHFQKCRLAIWVLGEQWLQTLVSDLRTSEPIRPPPVRANALLFLKGEIQFFCEGAALIAANLFNNKEQLARLRVKQTVINLSKWAQTRNAFIHFVFPD